MNRSVSLLGLFLYLIGTFLFRTSSVQAASVTLVTDSFTRNSTDSWGTADTGGLYTLSGTTANFDVSGTEGTVVIDTAAAAGYQTSLLSSTSREDTSATVKIKTNKISSGNSQAPYLIARHVASTTEYRGRVRLSAGGNVLLQAAKLVSGTETLLGTEVQVAGLTYSTNTFINVRMEVTGTNPTTINLRAWALAGSEPSNWTYTVTDSTPELQAAGSVGLIAGALVNANNLPIVQTFDDFSVTGNAYNLSGTVFTDNNSNNSQDVGETGYAGATITISGQNTTTDSLGSYSFSNLASGTKSVTLSVPAGYSSTSTNPTTISLNSDSTTNFGLSNINSAFQPNAPYYATFFYPWFRNPTTDGANSWGTWDDPDLGGTHSPTTNWFSNYLPNVNNNTNFTPSTGIYSSNDYSVFKWQLGGLVTAKQEVAISSWWGQSDSSNINATTSTIFNDFMRRSDNPYPNLRWALYYECEGNTCNSTTDPSVTQITSDLNYIGTNYATSPYYLRVGGKPVIFVYATGSDTGSTNTDCTDSSDTSMTHRWSQAIAAANTQFYYVLKVFSGYASKPCQPSSWHQYGPAVRTDSQGTYSYSISPGYWKSGQAMELSRDVSAFDVAAQNMVASNATWKLVETWNEWGEGSSVEPGQEVIQAYGSNPATANASGATFSTAFIDVLQNRLPALEKGTGVSNTSSNTSTSTGSGESKSSDPFFPPGFRTMTNAGPRRSLGFITGHAGSFIAKTLIPTNASVHDLTVSIYETNPLDLLSSANIPLPWVQGFNIASNLYKFSAVSAFNGMELNTFDSPVMVIIPYDPIRLGKIDTKNLRILAYNTKTKRWTIIPRPLAINAQTHELATTVTSFSYFTVGYPRN